MPRRLVIVRCQCVHIVRILLLVWVRLFIVQLWSEPLCLYLFLCKIPNLEQHSRNTWGIAKFWHRNFNNCAKEYFTSILHLHQMNYDGEKSVTKTVLLFQPQSVLEAASNDNVNEHWSASSPVLTSDDEWKLNNSSVRKLNQGGSTVFNAIHRQFHQTHSTVSSGRIIQTLKVAKSLTHSTVPASSKRVI